ncbi:MAG: hypothetical protein Q9183_005165, partial [Haloplaca sp. 2 TL-2023]
MLSTLLAVGPLCLLLASDTLAAPHAADGPEPTPAPLLRRKPQTPEQQAAGEAALRDEWEDYQEHLSYVDDFVAPTLDESYYQRQSSFFEYWETASFSDIPIPEATLDPELLDALENGTDAFENYTLPSYYDPCGPAVQDGTVSSTCTTEPDGEYNNDTVSGAFVYYAGGYPAVYGAQCHVVPGAESQSSGFTNSPTVERPAWNASACQIDSFCEGFVTENFPTDQWVWNTNGGPGCVVGAWYGSGEGLAPKPDATRCKYGIYRTMAEFCPWESDPPDSIMAVNVEELPTRESDGKQ